MTCQAEGAVGGLRSLSVLPNFFWFHAFRRKTVAEVVSVLLNGPAPNPNPECETRVHETALGVAPPSVYAYLGRTLEVFGNSAFLLPMASLVGQVSPFDTGGLIKKIMPVSGWPIDQKQEYLRKFSWSASELPKLLAVYPQTTTVAIRAYLECNNPSQDGPHQLWDGPEANIWKLNTDWRAWTWEGRQPDKLSVGTLARWTCPSDLYDEIQTYAETASADVADAVAELSSKYVRGGVSRLVRDMRAAQEAA